MTIQDVIAKVDELMPNQYSTEQKVAWLSTLDGKIFHEIVLTHWGSGLVFYPVDGYKDDYADLIIKQPYADDVYTYYLQSRIAAENNEIAKYNMYSTLFNEAYTDWVNFYNRMFQPIQRGRWRM